MQFRLNVLIGLLSLTWLSTVFAVNADSKIYSKFGYNLALNDERRPCVWFQEPPSSGVWFQSGGACTGGWAEAYTQYFLRRPIEAGTRWVRLDFDVILNGIDGNSGIDQNLSLANRQVFIEMGNILGDETLLWLGKRGYRWEGLWVIGMPIAVQDGVGLGFYNRNLGNFARLGLAAFRTVPWEKGPAQHTLDLRFEDIAIFSGRMKWILGLTETGSQDARSGERLYEPMKGQRMALIYDMWMQQSETRLVFAWGKGLYGSSDSRDYARGSWIEESGAWRAADTLDAAWNYDFRYFLRRSQTWRAGMQYRFYPQGSKWHLNFGLGLQILDFGGLRYINEAQVYTRPNMETLASSFQPVYRWHERWEAEFQFGHITVRQGLSNDHRLQDGTIQQSLQPVDRQLSHVRLALNYLPLGRWQVKFSPYFGYSWWNRLTRFDVSPETGRSSASYAGIQSSVEF